MRKTKTPRKESIEKSSTKEEVVSEAAPHQEVTVKVVAEQKPSSDVKARPPREAKAKTPAKSSNQNKRRPKSRIAAKFNTDELH